MKKHKNKIIAGIVIAVILAVAFIYGGAMPESDGEISEEVIIIQTDEQEKAEVVEKDNSVRIILEKEDEPKAEEDEPEAEEDEPEAEEDKSETEEDETEAKEDETEPEEDEPETEKNEVKKQDETHDTESSSEKGTVTEESTEPAQNLEEAQSLKEAESTVESKVSDEEYSEEQGMVINEATGKDEYRTDPVPEGKPIPIEPENAIITDNELTCTLSVRCDTILYNIGWLDSEKVSIVPEDGVIFEEKTVTFYEGESVFNLLMREMKRSKIHLEFVNTPIYNSAYIEGIANLYEFDCGELSGWMYKVNGWFPNYGCSRYQLKAGDRVEWVYTCDLGNDVGGNYSARNGN